ncbi:MAG: hypothetical protein QXS02_06655 [Candidatus Thermoplasmatota archaeon]
MSSILIFSDVFIAFALTTGIKDNKRMRRATPIANAFINLMVCISIHHTRSR